ncbi:MAG: molybdopterin-guanine dinucleotide biosynthesis protein B [Thermoactinomyces sp.]
MQVLQIAGYQNSGKTTLVEILVKELTSRGFRVGTLKHHGHGGKPVIPPRTDSTRHAEAGSLVAGVEGDGILLLTANYNKDWSLKELIRLYTFFPVDILLLEGYKQYPFPKFICLRDEKDAKLLQLPGVQAAFSFNKNLASCYYIPDQDSYLDRIIADVKGGAYVFHCPGTN